MSDAPAQVTRTHTPQTVSIMALQLSSNLSSMPLAPRKRGTSRSQRDPQLRSQDGGLKERSQISTRMYLRSKRLQERVPIQPTTCSHDSKSASAQSDMSGIFLPSRRASLCAVVAVPFAARYACFQGCFCRVFENFAAISTIQSIYRVRSICAHVYVSILSGIRRAGSFACTYTCASTRT